MTHVPNIHEEKKDDDFLIEDEENNPITAENKLSSMKPSLIKEIDNQLNKQPQRKNLLCITSKHNSLKKFGKPKNKEEHLHRVLTREKTPCAKYVLCPQLKQKKETNIQELNTYFVIIIL